MSTLTPSGTTTVSADSSASPAASVAPSSSFSFGRTAMAILATMVILIVALTGILVETTWHNPAAASEMPPGDPGSVARR
jgi:hypothetical protein